MESPEDKWQVAVRSDKGYVREENEDYMDTASLDWGQIYVVADGMGGHKAGALAAELTVQGLMKCLREKLPGAPVAEAIQQAFQETNKTVHEKACSEDPETKGLGSTAVLLLTMGSVAHVAHVGDSRAYLYRNGRLSRLTKDHSLIQRMLDRGMLSPAEAREHPDASVIYRAIGDKPQVEVDIGQSLPVEEGDGFLLCSDGLCGYVDDGEIEAVLRSSATVQETADQLIQLALGAGGRDNVTVQVVQYGKRIEPRDKGKGLLSKIAAATRVFARLRSHLFGMSKQELPKPRQDPIFGKCQGRYL